MKLIQLFVSGCDEAVINDELLDIKFKDGFVHVKYRTDDGGKYYEIHNAQKVNQISIFEESK